MRGDDLLDKMEYVDEDLIEAAGKMPKKKTKPWLKWGTIAACLCLAAAGIFMSGRINRASDSLGAHGNGSLSTNTHVDGSSSNTDQQGTDKLTPSASGSYALNIPAIQLPKKSKGVEFDMIALVVYKGGIYTQTQRYIGADAEGVDGLVGEKLGYATGEIDEWSTQDDYAEEFASSITGNIFSVKGYSTDYRLCMSTFYEDEDGNQVKYIEFFERLNGIGITDGEDLFGDRLNTKERLESIKYQTHDDWNNSHNNYKDLPDITSAQINSFLDTLYTGRFEYLHEKDPNFYSDAKKQTHLYLCMNDNTIVELRLMEGGYVGYQWMGWYFVRMPGEAFDAIFNACQ